MATGRTSVDPPPPAGWDWQVQDGRSAECLPAVPALLRTRLQLELLLQNPVIDLRAVAEVLLGDLGATIEVFRLAGREWESGEERPTRIEDALASLPLESCLQAVSRAAFSRDGRFVAAMVAWGHAREVAQSMRAASELENSIHPEQAYLVGLLHELGALPALLGWPGAFLSRHHRHPGRSSAAQATQFSSSQLAESWGLPSFLMAALKELESGRRSSPWVRLLNAAHGWAQGTGEAHRTGRPAETARRVAVAGPGRKSRVLSFDSFEPPQWKSRIAGLEPAPMRPPA